MSSVTTIIELSNSISDIEKNILSAYQIAASTENKYIQNLIEKLLPSIFDRRTTLLALLAGAS